MKYLTFLLLLALSTPLIYSQEFSREFGNISKSEIELSQYSSDKSVESVVLYDIGKSYDIEAYTYNYENGQLNKTKLNTSNCHNEKINEYWVVKKFAMPNVKAGSIVEYKYKINSEYKFNLKDWEFQWKIPVVYSEYQVNMIPFYEYSYLLQGANKFDSQTTGTGSVFRRFV